jgi:ubiquinone biosynthesis protein
MVELLGVLIIILAVFLLRRLLGIRRGRWVTTLIAVVVGDIAAVFVLRMIYGGVAKIPSRALFGAWALLTVFAMFTVVLVELLSRPVARRARHGLPHPIQGVRRLTRRAVRSAQVARVLFRSGLFHTGEDQGDVAGSRLGRSLRAAFEDAGGLFVKLGQAMAEQPQLVTRPVSQELAKLHEQAAPADAAAARAVIAAELGPPEEVFTEISSVPLGSASIAQTYLAHLRDGREVVVKVQRPGVVESIECDLDILHLGVELLNRRTSWAHSLGLEELVAGFDERTREELDFRIEAANGIAARRALRDSDPVAVPEVIDGFSTRRVLVEERAEGRSVGAPGVFDGWDPRRRETLADGLLSMMMRQMMDGEPFHADPHPGNVFLRPDGRLELIDFGAVARLDAFERSGLVDMLRGLQTKDPSLVREGVLRIGTATHGIEEDAFDRELARLMSRSLPPDGTLNPELFQDVLFVLRDFGVVLPRSSTMLFRTLVTLLGTLQMIAPGYQIMEAALRVGRGVMAEQAPQNLQELLLSEAVKDAPILRRLPRELDAIARRVLHGDLRMRVSLLSEPEDVQMAKGMVNRLVMGVASAAFVLSSAILLSASSAPTLGGVRVVNLLGGVGLFISILLLVRLVVEILRDRG